MTGENNLLSYDDIRDLATKAGIADNKVSIGLWAKIKGFVKVKREIRNNKFVWLYRKDD